MKHIPVHSLLALAAFSYAVLAREDSLIERGTRFLGGEQPKPTLANQEAVTERPLEGSARKAIETFFVTLEKNEVDAAYTQLTKGTRIGEKLEELNQLKNKTRQAISVFGEIQGHELIGTRYTGANLVRATYISLGKNFPLRWRFYLYGVGGEWKLIDIRVDDRLGDMMGEASEKEA